MPIYDDTMRKTLGFLLQITQERVVTCEEDECVIDWRGVSFRFGITSLARQAEEASRERGVHRLAAR